jgi:glycerophosphoryl diester phosphodiesterase
MKKTFTTLVIASAIALASSCKKDDASLKEDSAAQNVLALGHGGMGNANFYPMNSYESLLNCINLGSDGSEMDVQMTKDSVLIAYHDETLETLTDGSGPIINYTWAELQQFKYQAAPYVDYSIASIDVLFSHLDNLQQLHFSFDNKLYFDDSIRPIFMRAVINLLVKYQMEQNVFIESHDPVFLSAFKTLKDYKYFLNPDTFDEGLSEATNRGLYGIIMDDENISADQISTAHQNGLKVQTWGPATKDANIKAVEKNPDAIQTDNVNALVSILNE